MFDLVENWELINFFVYIGLLLFIAKIIKEKLPFLNKIIIPSALIAGFIGLILSYGFFDIISLSEMNDDGDMVRIPIIYDTVYHAIAIGFIALTLRRDKNETNKKVWSTGMVIVITYLFQAVIGVTIVILFFKNTFLGAGLLLPLGFGQGPGLATSIGGGYAEGVGVLLDGGALGATIASIGFLVGGIVGVVALNYYARKNNLVVNKVHKEESSMKESFEVETIKEIRVFDALTMQVVIIFIIYFFVYLTLVALENYVLPLMGDLGATFASVFHGFNFLIGIIYALIYRKILKVVEDKGKNINFLTNNYVLSNISSLAFNFMIVAAVLTITIQSIKEYYLLVTVMAIVATVLTFILLKWISRKIYAGKYEIHYFLGMFGMLTGTASTGLALLKGVDRNFESPIAEEMVVGSGTAISMALPLFALLMFPGLAITTGNSIYILLTFAIPIAYGLLLLGILLYVNREKK
jgi:ESS family glutamate:Na+ symporter